MRENYGNQPFVAFSQITLLFFSLLFFNLRPPRNKKTCWGLWNEVQLEINRQFWFDEDLKMRVSFSAQIKRNNNKTTCYYVQTSGFFFLHQISNIRPSQRWRTRRRIGGSRDDRKKPNKKQLYISILNFSLQNQSGRRWLVFGHFVPKRPQRSDSITPNGIRIQRVATE